MKQRQYEIYYNYGFIITLLFYTASCHKNQIIIDEDIENQAFTDKNDIKKTKIKYIVFEKIY